MIADRATPEQSHLNRAVEVSIHTGLIFLLAATCLTIPKPFIAVAAWGLIIAIAGYPGYRWLQKLMGGGVGFTNIAIRDSLTAKTGSARLYRSDSYCIQPAHSGTHR